MTGQRSAVRQRPRARRGLVAALAVALAGTVSVGSIGILGPLGAVAATDTDYASWTFTGTNHSYAGTVDLATGFPAVTLASDSRTPPSPPVVSGSTVWLPLGTPFAGTFGPSRDQPYLSLRPYADNPTSPSTTTYTFATPTPVGTWGVNLGDVDAERLVVSALGADGLPVAAADLGFGPPYSYCAASPRSSSCSGQAAPYATPTVVPAATSVTVEDPLCPTIDATRCDTQGAAAFFVPTVPLTSLTITSTQKQGLPAYQTWFATLRGTITGAVAPACPLEDPPSVELLSADGAVVATAAVGDDGSYAFGPLARGVGYTVRVDPGTLPAGAASTPRDLGVLDLAEVTAPDLDVTVPRAVRGTATGPGAGGAAVVLTPAAGAAVRTTAADDGAYAFDDVAPGEYVVTLEPAAGSDATVEPAQASVTVGCDDVVVPAFTLTEPDPEPTPTPTPTEPTPTPTPTEPTPTEPTPAPTPTASATAEPTPSTEPTETPTTVATATALPAATASFAAAADGPNLAADGVTGPADTGGLAATGSAATVPAAVASAALLLLGITLLLARRRS
ncbi:hypothetical protein [Cellulomonas sp. PhB143]|uniref:hypothetical protein n=1 Tax=Cellulomonas sp. PhB143 TaxID=2485186 RepID=UPI000FABF73E|nr:hypothetical protein [Cellulomonas sp. PhB143]ROS75387.1 hypothetical protein EDF32_1796 [Cellulomonas sp. PhB143]